MKKLILFLLSISLLAAYTPTLAASQAEIYVSAAGDDAGMGTKDSPFRTLVRAREAVRAINGNMNGDITVNIGEGVYYQDEPFKLSHEDSGTNGYKVIYRGTGEGEAVISGGVPLGEWTQYEGDIWVTDVPEGFDKPVNGLYIGREAATLSINEKKLDVTGMYDDTTIRNGHDSGYDAMVIAPDQIEPFKNPTDLFLKYQWSWRNHTIPITRMEKQDDGSIRVFSDPEGVLISALYIHQPENQIKGCYIANSYEFMDKPGEFSYSSKDRKIYYKKPEHQDLTTEQTYIPKLTRVLEIEGDHTNARAENIVVEGLTFAHTSSYRVNEVGVISTQGQMMVGPDYWEDRQTGALFGTLGGVWIGYARNILFTRNDVRQMENVGIGIYDCTNDVQIIGNAIYDCADSAVTVGTPAHGFNYERELGLVNVSEGKIATASSYDGAHSPGNLTGPGHLFLYMPNGGKNWVMIDLEKPEKIKKIRIVPRGDSPTEVHAIRILASNDPEFMAYETLYIHPDKVDMDAEHFIDVKVPYPFRYVMLERDGTIAMNSIDIFAEGENYRNEPSVNTKVSNNLITRVGKQFRGAPGIQAYYVDSVEISHNDMSNLPYTGIAMGWGWGAKNTTLKNNKILNNRIENYQMHSFDGGGIYTLSHQPGSEIKGNFLKDSFYQYGGIYPDNGSQDFAIENNVMENTVLSFHPWSSDESNIRIENNYSTEPNYAFGAQNSYMKNQQIYALGYRPAEVQKIVDEAGLEEEYADIGKYANKKIIHKYEGEYPEYDDYETELMMLGQVALARRELAKAKSVSKLAQLNKFTAGEYTAAYEALQTAIKETEDFMYSEKNADKELNIKYYDMLRIAVENYVSLGMFEGEYEMYVQSVGVEVDDSHIPVISTKLPINGGFLQTDYEGYNTPDATTRFRKDNTYTFQSGTSQMSYANAKFGDSTFELDLNFTPIPGDFPGFYLRSKNPSSIFYDKGNEGYFVGFTTAGIEVQKFNDGERTVFYGTIGDFVPKIAANLPLDPFKFGENNHVVVSINNEAEGVRLAMSINGKEVMNFVDTDENAIRTPGYFGFVTPSTQGILTNTSETYKGFEDLGGYETDRFAIEQLALAGIINGVEANKFSPYTEVTPEQEAVLRQRVADKYGISIDNVTLAGLTRAEAAVLMYNAISGGAK